MNDNIQTLMPSTDLSRYIECYWSWQVAPTGQELDAILPDASPELLFHLGAPPRALRHDGKWTVQPQYFLINAANRTVRLESDSTLHLFAIRFRPWGASRFSDRPMAEMLDHEILIGEAFPSFGEMLADRIAQATIFEQRADIVNETLGNMLQSRSRKEKRILAISGLVSDGQTKSSDMARSLNISERSFRRHWAEIVGVEHRKFNSLMRFHRAIEMIDGGSELSAVAFDCGYADQPHLARDVKRICGLSPAMLKKRLGDEVYTALYRNRASAPWTFG